MRQLREWVMRQMFTVFARQPYEQIVGGCNVRGVLYIITTDRIVRYDPERDQLTNESHTR